MTDVDWGPVAFWVGAFASFLAVIVALQGGMGWFSRRHRPLLIGLTTDGRARSDIDPVRLRISHLWLAALAGLRSRQR